MSLTKTRRSSHKKMSKSWRSPGPYSVNTQGLAAGEDYLIRNLEEIKKGYYKEEGRREAHVDQRLTNLEQRSDMVETALAELKKNLSIVLAIGGLINGLLDWLRARGGVKKI